jgi:hypothetical protein
MILPVAAFIITRNPISFTLFGTLTPPAYILSRIAKYLFTKEEEPQVVKKAQQRKSSKNP